MEYFRVGHVRNLDAVDRGLPLHNQPDGRRQGGGRIELVDGTAESGRVAVSEDVCPNEFIGEGFYDIALDGDQLEITEAIKATDQCVGRAKALESPPIWSAIADGASHPRTALAQGDGQSVERTLRRLALPVDSLAIRAPRPGHPRCGLNPRVDLARTEHDAHQAPLGRQRGRSSDPRPR
jgi:hypothetical protein